MKITLHVLPATKCAQSLPIAECFLGQRLSHMDQQMCRQNHRNGVPVGSGWRIVDATQRNTIQGLRIGS